MNQQPNNDKSVKKIKVKLATLVKGGPKARFSIAITSWCRGGHYSLPWIAPLYPWSLPYIAECCGPVKGPEERHELGFTWNKVY